MDLGGYHARAGSALGIRIIAFSSVFCGIYFPLTIYLASFLLSPHSGIGLGPTIPLFPITYYVISLPSFLYSYCVVLSRYRFLANVEEVPSIPARRSNDEECLLH